MCCFIKSLFLDVFSFEWRAFFLFQVRLCPDCSYKLNYHHKKKEVTKKLKKKKDKKKKRRHRDSDSSGSGDDGETSKRQKLEEAKKEEEEDKKATEIWSAPVQMEEEKSREDDFAEYLEDLFM